MAMLQPVFHEKWDHFSGPVSAPVHLTEYGDLQCTHCAEAYSAVKFLQQQMGDNLRFVFRHYPQPVLHALSLDASVAAETAALQGRFWEMHNVMLENQQYLTRARIRHFAEDIGLDMSAYEDHREHRKLVRKVIGDYESGVKSGVKSGVDGTPTFFINGRRYNGFHDADSLYRTCKFVLQSEAIPAPGWLSGT